MVQYYPVVTGSLTINGSLSVSGPMSITGSIAGTSSLASNALLLDGTGSVGFTTTGSFTATSSSLSSRTTQIESVYATTGSNSFRATQSITGSLTVTGQIIAQTLNVQQVTSSIIYSSGSNVFGCDINSRQVFTGSFYQTGSVAIFSNCIGIGTTPIQQLTIVGGTTSPGSFSGNYAFGLVSGSSQAFAIGNDSSFAYVQSFSSRPLYLNSQGNNVILAGPGANVGIGTTSPATKFVISNAGAEGFEFIPADSSNYNRIQSYSRSGGVYNTLETRASTHIWAIDATERMRINSSGNVGIGTCTPTAIGNYKSLTLDGIDGSIVDFRLNGGEYGRVFTNSNTALGLESLSTTLPLVFKTQNGSGSTERMRITNAGNVCIGSASVSGEILRVNGCSCLDNYISVYSGTIQMFLDADKTNNAGIVGTQSGHPLILRTNGTNKLSISTAGVLDFPGSNSTATSASDSMSFGISGASYAWIQTWASRPLRINELGNNVNAFGTNGYGLVNTTASDVRIKKNIVSIENALAKVNCLRGVYYEFDENNSMCMKVPSGKRRVGLIAQEVGCVLPEALLDSQDDSTPISLDYSGMIGLLTKAIQEQQCTINTLKTCIGIA